MRNTDIVTLVCSHTGWVFQVDGARIEGNDYDELLDLFIEPKLKATVFTTRIDILLYKLEGKIDKVYRNHVHNNLIISAIYQDRITFVNYYNWHKAIEIEDADNDSIEKEMRELAEAHPTWRKFPVSPSGIVRKELLKLDLGKTRNKLLFKTEEQYELYNSLLKKGFIGFVDEFAGEELTVNSYDIKSSYPYIMCEYEFPYSMDRVVENYPIEKFNKLVETDYLWVAEIEFAERPLLRTDGLDLFHDDIQTCMTLTSTDCRILQSEYITNIKNINKIIIHRNKEKLPEELTNFIYNQFEIKESYPHDSNEYKEAKIALNSIFGLFYQDIKKYDESKINGDFPMAIGAWTAAYGRLRLYTQMNKVRYGVIYWDTDGFKTTIPIEEEFDTEKKLGSWVLEKEEKEFIFFGKKQYYLDGELSCAGLNKKLANEYLKENNIKPYDGMVIPEDYTGGWYYDENHNEIKTKYQLGGNG